MIPGDFFVFYINIRDTAIPFNFSDWVIVVFLVLIDTDTEMSHLLSASIYSVTDITVHLIKLCLCWFSDEFHD